MKNLKHFIFAGIMIFALSSCSGSSNGLSASVLTADDFNQNNYLKTPSQIELILADQKTASTVNVLDVRTPAEFQSGCLAGSKNIDFEAPDFTTKIAELDKNANYLLYCRTGRRSGLAVTQFRQQGFKNIIELKGGITAWTKDGKPVSQNCR
jgi:rhodanese-related sulfurtransferase